jgi:hypothetical protein
MKCFDLSYTLPTGHGRSPYTFAKSKAAAVAAIKKIQPGATNFIVNGVS